MQCPLCSIFKEKNVVCTNDFIDCKDGRKIAKYKC